MKRKRLQQGLAMFLSAAMLVTGISFPGVTAMAANAEQIVFEDDMESKTTEEAGWTVTWSDNENLGTEVREANEWASANKTKWWVFSTKEAAQQITISKTIADVKAGNYKVSLDADGDDPGKDLHPTGTVSISVPGSSESRKSKEITFGGWDDFKTTETEPLTVPEASSLLIQIDITTQKEGWFDLDNIKVIQELSDDEAKGTALNNLKNLIDECKALKQQDYQATSWNALQKEISNAEAVYRDSENKTVEEINAARTALENAKNSLIDAGVVENAGVNVSKVQGITDDFVRGVDISTFASLVDSGVTFKDWDGKTLDEVGFFKLLKDAGVNYVRIRVWNDPYADAEKKQGYGAGNCDVTKAAKMGAWATQAGLKVMIDFHYSDFWADPGRQVVPKAWKDYTVDQKADAISAFTEASLNTIIEAGADVGMVQVGNETTSGICGVSNKSWDDMATLFKAGCNAVHKVAGEKGKEILAAIHFTNPEKTSTMKGYADTLHDKGVDYDVFATSYYPYWHGSRENLTDVLKYVADTYNKEVMVAETSWARTFEDGDGQPNVVRQGQNDDTSVYAATVQGQANEVRDVIEAVAKVGEKGMGVMYWEPAWLPVHVYDADAENADEILAANKQAWETYGSGWASSYSIDYDPNVNENNYGGSEWDNQAMFDFEGNPLPSLNVFKYVFTGAVTPKRLDTITDSSISAEYGEDIAAKLPTTVTGVYNDGTKAENLPVVWDPADIAAIKGFGSFKIKGTVTYTTEDNQTASIQAICTVEVSPKNLLLQGGFEEGRDQWTIEGTGINSKETENPRSGEKCLAFYSADAYQLTATQSITVETTGTYSAFMYLQGGSEDQAKANIKLTNETTGVSSDADALVKGWLVWQNPNTGEVEASKGDILTVNITISGEAGSWGSVDDVYLYQKETETKLTKIQLNATSKTVQRGKSFTLTAKVFPENATNQSLNWSSSKDSVATVSETGVVKAKGPGEAVITAEATDGSGVKAQCKVIVPYKITYKLNKGNNHKSNPSTYYNQKVTLKNASRKGYTFGGWYSDSKFKKKVTSISKNSKKDLTLYAKWNKVSVKKASVKKVSNISGKKAKVVINKVSGAKGYRIAYSTDKNFKKGVNKIDTKNTTKTLAKLKKGKTYYVKICAYKLDSKGDKVFGTYSKTVKVKIKK